jgi:hypothetical protein
MTRTGCGTRKGGYTPLPSVLAASAAGVCQACKDPRFKKKGWLHRVPHWGAGYVQGMHRNTAPNKETGQDNYDDWHRLPLAVMPQKVTMLQQVTSAVLDC